MTVAELVTLLQAQPQDLEVYIDDPDTGWLLTVGKHPYGSEPVRLETDDQGDCVVICSEGY